MTARVPPVVLVFGAIFSLQFGAGFAITIFDEVGAAGAAALRLALAAVFMLAVWRPRPRDHTPEALRVAVLFGLALGVMNYTFYEALDRIPLGIAVTIEFVGPLGVAVAGSRSRLDVLWVVLAGAGIVLLTSPWDASTPDPLGVAFALAAGACWAAYIVLAQRTGTHFTGSTGLAIAMALAALVPLGPGIASGGAELLAPEILAIGLAVALLSSVIPYSLETEALRRMPRNVFGVLMSLEPAVAALAGLVVLSQSLDARELLAIGLVVAASAGATRAPVPDPA
ncbi:MAG TPA: EamA family transporter [Solirubrobacteraceae bacterium]|nr:EamA family transporter [Solirubrobacteraceae bacterium]